MTSSTRRFRQHVNGVDEERRVFAFLDPALLPELFGKFLPLAQQVIKILSLSEATSEEATPRPTKRPALKQFH